MNQNTFFSQIFDRTILLCLFTGFSSGLPYFVLHQLIPAWLADSQLDLTTIGAFTLISLPYTWKFLIAPLLDRYSPPFLGRRRSWIALTQLSAFLLIMLLGQFDPRQDTQWVAIIAVMIALSSAMQDIVIDAYRREILTDNQLGLGNSIHIYAYRIAGLIPGGVSLILAESYSWETVFIFTALFMWIGVIFSLFIANEPNSPPIDRSLPFYQTFTLPFKEFFQRKGIWAGVGLILFIFLYKFGDALATSLQTKFIRDMGFSNFDLGTVVKANSLWASIGAGIVGGIAMLKLGINRCLWLFGFVQLITILGFAWLAHFEHFPQIGRTEIMYLSLVIIGEYIGVGLGTAAFVAFMAKETNKLYTATQLAIFTSLSAIPSRFFGAFSGALVEQVGYYTFFWICFFCAIPGMICLYWVAPWNKQ